MYVCIRPYAGYLLPSTFYILLPSTFYLMPLYRLPSTPCPSPPTYLAPPTLHLRCNLLPSTFFLLPSTFYLPPPAPNLRPETSTFYLLPSTSCPSYSTICRLHPLPFPLSLSLHPPHRDRSLFSPLAPWCCSGPPLQPSCSPPSCSLPPPPRTMPTNRNRGMGGREEWMGK